MYPFAEQILGFAVRTTPTGAPGGLVLEVKGDFCHKVRGLLERYGRATITWRSAWNRKYRYNPLHNDLDAYALAYGIASLLNNLFGKGKEPFWQQAYTNLVKFIILLHKTLYDYVTLFDVYECAINPALLATGSRRRGDVQHATHAGGRRHVPGAHGPRRVPMGAAIEQRALHEGRSNRRNSRLTLGIERIAFELLTERGARQVGDCPDSGPVRGRQALVQPRLDADRAEAADVHRRRHLGLPVALR